MHNEIDHPSLDKANDAEEVKEEGRRPERRGPWKPRRAKGETRILMDIVLRLHTFFRDHAQLIKESDMSSYELQAAMAFELAELLKEEYDKLHG